MTNLLAIMDAISWPIVALLVALLSAFGGLNKPISSISESFGGVVKSLKDFKTELNGFDERLKVISEEIPSKLDTVREELKSLDSEFGANLKSMTNSLVAFQEKTRNAAILEARDEATSGFDNNEPQDGALGTSNLSKDDAATSINSIAEKWSTVRVTIAETFPAAEGFDRREYGQAIRAFANGASAPKPSVDMAEKVSDLHSRFKSITRRRSYAEEWLTREIVDKYLSDADNVITSVRDEIRDTNH